MAAALYAVRKDGRTWSVVRVSDGYVVEGGFFSRAAAVASALWWEANHPAPSKAVK